MNRLADALSPYLRQHADNPVDWREWGPEALAEAERRQVPLLISVGYAACHWCHVMAHESFADPETAALINELTVPVKVDREERPDVDAVYMRATLAMTGQGGWPMTVFAAPDGSPFYAGTYYPREHFVKLLEAVGQAWSTRREEVLAQGAAVVEACSGTGLPLADAARVCPIGEPCPPTPPISREQLDAAAEAMRAELDPVNGGFGRAPKFPTQPAVGFLLEHAAADAETAPDDLAAVRLTLESMARGGIWDQLAGGFARYSVDATWTVPHFEKMLYDNAQLLGLYARASGADAAQTALFRRIAAQTAEFLIRDLGTPEGGFASALDADSEGREGAAYVWNREQLREVLGDEDGDWAARVFDVPVDGNFEAGLSVLQLPSDPEDRERHERVREALLRERLRRPQPERDDKVVTAWNGMAIRELSRYARGVADPDEAERAGRAALRAGRLLADVHYEDGRLRRVSRGGTAGSAAGVLEDYAAVSLAFVELFELEGESRWLRLAERLNRTVIEQFGDEAGGFCDTAAEAEKLVARPADPGDGPTPSGWALAAEALWEQSRLGAASDGEDEAWRALACLAPALERAPRFLAGAGSVALRMLD